MKIKYLLFLLIFLSSCGVLRSPEERAKRRIKKILVKYPDISSSEERRRIDTIVSLDSFLLREVSIDTSFIFSSDTIFFVSNGKVSTEVQIIDRERLLLKTIVQADTIYFRDTLIREQTIIREIIKPLEASFFDKYGILLILAVVVVIGYMLKLFV